MDMPHFKSEKESSLPVSILPQVKDYAKALEDNKRRLAQRRRRFFSFSAILFAVSVWITGRHWVLDKPILPSFSCGKSKPPGAPPEIPPGVILKKCTKWDDEDESSNGTSTMNTQPVTSWAEFSLPIDKNLFFVSRGSFSIGSFKIIQSNDRVSTHAKAKVAVTYENEHILDFSRVCKISRLGDDGKKSTGIGIFTPRWQGRYPRPPHNIPRFDLTLELPQAKKKSDKDGAPLRISSLETDMPLFTHSIWHLATVNFGKLLLSTSNAPVDVLDVWANNIIVNTANAAIDGTYRAWSSITLTTANAPISVALELQNLNSTNATYANLITTNSPISAETKLATVDSNSGGNFSVSASTVNSPLSLIFTSAPINSTLNVKGVTLLGSAKASLPPTFEGTIALKTVLASADVVASSKEKDPEGQGRTRTVDLDRASSSEVNGTIWWDKTRSNAGSVELNSSFAPVTIFV